MGARAIMLKRGPLRVAVALRLEAIGLVGGEES